MKFTGERLIPGAKDVEPNFQKKMIAEHLNRYQFAGFFAKNKTVLDMGCGVGYGSDFLSRQGAKSVTGVDKSSSAISYALSHYKKRGLDFLIANAEKFPFEDRKFDLVVALEVIEHVKDYQKVLQEIKRALKNEGILVISTPQKKEEKRSVFHTHEFTQKEFKKALGPLFKSIKFFIQKNFLISAISNGNFSQFQEIRGEKNYSLEAGDYFIAVCGKCKNYPKTLAFLNNDSYVWQLEKERNYSIKELERKSREKELLIQNIYQSYSWRIGHFIIKILCPFYYFFQKLFNKLKKIK